jgi:hypothetical protein
MGFIGPSLHESFSRALQARNHGASHGRTTLVTLNYFKLQ